MPKYLVIYSKGSAHLQGGGVHYEKQPGRHQLEVSAGDKCEAFVRAYQHFEKLGLRTTVEEDGDGRNKLGFSDEQIGRVSDCGAIFTTAHQTGIRIEKIIPAL